MPKSPKFFGKQLQLSWTEIITGGAMMLLGLVLLIWPGVTTSVLFASIGAVCFIIGLVHVVRYSMLEKKQAIIGNDLAIGLAWIIGGASVVIFKGLLLSILPFFFGMIVLIGGVIKIQHTLGFKRMNAARWYIELICAGVSILLGALILVNPFSTALLLMRIIGGALILEGAMDLASRVAFKKTCNSYFVEFEEDK